MPEARDMMAARQKEVVAALLGADVLPAGFEKEALQTTAEVLAYKRKKALLAAWPAIADELPGQWQGLLEDYFEVTPPVEARRDGRNFLRYLDGRGIDITSFAEAAFRYDLARGFPIRLRKVGRRWMTGARFFGNVLIARW